MAADGVSTLQVVVEGKDETTRVLKGIESSIIRFVGAVSAALAAVNVAVFPVKAAATFQRELLNVGKTTNFTDTQLTQLADGLKTLSYRLNVSAEDLAKIAAAGGQMGLGKEGVEGIITFTEAASRLASVLNLTADDAGSAIGRLTNIFKISVKDAEQISSLLNEISNNSTAGGADLIDMVQRIGTAGGTLGIKQAAALAATGRDLGLTVETVGTSFNKIFLDLQTKAADIAPILGLPVEQFAKIAREDGVEALKMWIEALNKMDSVQKAVLSEQITGGGRIFALMTSLGKDGATGFELLNKHLAEANKGFDEGKSAIQEQERVLTGLIAQGQILQNVFVGMGEAVGRKALPYLTRLTKQLQEWAKDPAVSEAFDRFAESIGSVVDTAISLIQTISGLSVVMGPLLTAMKYFLYFKIADTAIGMASSLYKMASAAGVATKAWWALLTAQKATVQSMAAASREVQANNATVAGSGKTPKTISTAGRVASYLDTALSAKYAAQDQLTSLTAKQAEAEKLLIERTEQRARVLAGVRTEMDRISQTSKAQAQAAYDAVISAGGTKKAAKAAQSEVKAALNRATLDLQVAASNLDVRYNESIARRSENLKSISTQAGQTRKALEGMSTAGMLFASLRTSIAGAAAALGTLAMRFLSVAGTIAGVIGLVAMLLDMFGLLDPALAAIKKALGIADEAQLEQNRKAQERQKAWEVERRQAEEILKVYEAQKKAKEDAAKAGLATGNKSEKDSSLSAQAAQLANINGAYLALSARGVEIASSLDFVDVKWREINAQLEAAKKAYDDIQKKKLEQDIARPSKSLSFTISDKDIKAAKAKVDDLTNSLDMLGKARQSFEQDAKTNADKIKEVTSEAVAQAEKLAPLYGASGVAALQSFEKVLEAQKKLDEAIKARDELAKTGDSATASSDDKVKYITAAENVKVLEKELAVLKTGYEEVRLSSANATVFMANAFPDATKATVDKVQSLLKVLGGASDGFSATLENSKLELDAQAKDITKQLDELTKTRDKAIAKATINGSGSLMDLDGEKLKKQIKDIQDAYILKSSTLKNSLGMVQAKQSSLTLETTEANALTAAYGRISDAKKKSMDAGKGLVANFAGTAALKSLTDLQIAAQRRVVEGAKANSDNLKRLYEEAKSNLVSTISETKREIASLGQYLQSRNLTLKLANFDIDRSRGEEQAKKFQDDIVEAERKRLEAQGLSSEEINKQIGMLQEMFAWSDKIRQTQQDEARQRMIVNELQAQMKSDQQDIADASARAVDLANKARAAQQAGNTEASAEYAKQAQIEAEKAKLATESLTEKVKEFKSEAAKPISGANGAYFVVSDAEVKQAVESSAKARVESAQAVEKATAQASASADKWAVDQAAALESLKGKAETYQKTLEAIGKIAPQLMAVQDSLSAAVLGKAEGIQTVVEDLKSIANTDFRGLDQLASISAQSKEVAAMESSIKGIASTYADTVVPAGKSIADVTKEVSANLASLKDGKDSMVASLQSAITDARLSAKVAFPDATDTLQSQLNEKTFSANIQFANGAGNNVQQHAEGGLIQGPGTGTSDSILSWVSNGEFINDAQTTSFWGPEFFSTLKAIARGGKGALTTFATKMLGGVSLPAFASGGYVGAPALAATGGVVNLFANGDGEGNIIGRVAVDLNAGGDKVSLLGERGEVDKLLKALHRMNRG